eukprot:5863449-Prymnesium_polylepis.1
MSRCSARGCITCPSRQRCTTSLTPSCGCASTPRKQRRSPRRARQSSRHWWRRARSPYAARLCGLEPEYITW